jgi:hypothetical protein
MNQVHHAWVWVGIAGAAGGVVNAWVSDNRFFWPSRIAASPRLRIVRPGLAVNAVIGAFASLMGVWAFTAAACARLDVPIATDPIAVIGAVVVGSLVSRLVTDEVDKRLLTAAVSKACTAPAAHPDTAMAIEVSRPYFVFTTASALAPKFHRRDGGR